MKEMVEIIGTLYEMEGLQKVTFWWKVQSMLLWVFQDGAASRAEAIFGILDFNGIMDPIFQNSNLKLHKSKVVWAELNFVAQQKTPKKCNQT